MSANHHCPAAIIVATPDQTTRYPARKVHHGTSESCRTMSRSEASTGTAVGAIIASTISNHMASIVPAPAC